MKSTLDQILAVVAMNFRSLGQGLWMSLATVIAIAVVVGLLLAFMSMASGFRETLENGGSDTVVIVTRQGSLSELNSTLDSEQIKIIGNGPGLALDDKGNSLTSSELYVIVDGIKKTTETKVNLPMRGISPNGFLLRDNVEIVEGRLFEPGKNEIVVGEGVLKQFSGFELGRELTFGKTRWVVVGVFSTGGSAFESELWTDVRDVQSQFNRGNSFQSLRVRLENVESLQPLLDYIKADSRLNVDAKTETEYLADQGSALDGIVAIGWALSIAMALGALAGALNTMYNSVAARARDIATLRAIGFGGLATFVGTLMESLLLSLIGGVLGSVAVFLLFDGITSSTLGANFTQVVFSFELTADSIKDAILLALMVGLIGGLPPAWRSARVPIVEAFRA